MHGGEPEAWNNQSKKFGALPFVELQLPLSLAPTQAEKEQSSLIGFKFGEQLFTDIDILEAGEWTDQGVCRFEVRSPGAEMISLQFSEFDLTEGAKVFIYNSDRTYFIGSFTKANNKVAGTLATAVIPGDAIVIEYHMPVLTNRKCKLKLGSITHGYLDIFNFNESKDIDPGYQSAPCHNNAICPIASAWQSEKRSVVLFLRPSGAGCTGSILNNTANDGTPYFYLANHCYQANEDQWVFYFNYGSETCVGSFGPTGQTISGSTLRSINYFDDFALVELSSTPPANYGVYYAGWDNSGDVPSNQTVIHHPLYDVKKITFDDDPATSDSITPYMGSPFDIHLWVNTWDNGIVEPVSSGAPLFDQNHRVIGHMTDGASGCIGPYETGCAKFSYSWDGSSSSTRLRDWLDPSNNTTTLDGYDPNAFPANVSVQLRAMLQGPYSNNTMLMSDVLRDSAYIPLNEPYTDLGYSFVGGGGESIDPSVLIIFGDDAIVDWLIVELRDKNDPTTIVASRAALIQRDGDIVDIDGSSPVQFEIANDDRYIAIRHRNHLGVMLQNPVHVDDSPGIIDISSGAVPMFGIEPLAVDNGIYLLWSGDATFNGELKYTGSGNDRDHILNTLGGTIPTATITGYYDEDADLDGIVKYTGINNDRDIILLNIGGVVPTGVRQEQLP